MAIAAIWTFASEAGDDADALHSLTAMELSGYCASESRIERAFCRGYVMALSSSGSMEANKRICLPDKTSVGELTNTVVSWIEDHPDQSDEHASEHVLSALRETFPC